MSDKVFLDSNLFVYAVDRRDLAKQKTARELLEKVALSRRGVVSSQVCLEYAANVIRKLGQSPATVATSLSIFAPFEWIPVSHRVVEEALALQSRYSLSIWDASIVAAAQAARCRIVYSEDMQHGLRMDGLAIQNPLR